MPSQALVGLLLGVFIVGCPGTEVPDIPPIAFVTSALPEVELGERYDVEIGVRGGEPPYSFAIIDGTPPAGIESQISGRLTGIAGAPGRATFTVQVIDAGARQASMPFEIYVVPDPLEIVSTRVPNAREGDAYDQGLVARGGVPPIVWSLVSGELPAGIGVADVGSLIGTPTAFGGFDFTVQAQDAETKTATRSLQLFVESLDPMIQTSTIPGARIASPYSVQFEADSGRPPFTWSIAAGTLPDGIALALDGNLAGTPLEDGSFTFTVRVDDSAARRDEMAYTLRVIAPLVIETRALPQVLRGRQVDFPVVATGGLEPYRWELRPSRCADPNAQSGLPMGLELDEDGRITGTTSAAGRYCFAIRVIDAEGFVALSRFTLMVSDRFTYEVEPMLAFPPVCTSTRVSYATVTIDVLDSFQIEDIDIAVDLDLTDSDQRPSQQNRKLKLMVFAPDGTRGNLCGNGAGIRGWQGCSGSGGVHTTYGSLTQPDRPLSAFNGLNAMGQWRIIAVIARPSVDNLGRCEQTGMVNGVTLSMSVDESADPYIQVGGYVKNNLSVDPWVRLTSARSLQQAEITLTAAIFDVGPNGRREGGLGDDVPRADPVVWTYTPATNGGADATVTPGGRVTAGRTTGNGQLTAEAGGLTFTTTLRVLPPDWNPDVRTY